MIRPHVLDKIESVWGFRSLKPFQAEAMLPELEGRDSLTVAATGAGKSLCFQAPALLRDELTVVVTPLIALMRNQVSELRRRGFAASCLHSGMLHHEQAAVEKAALRGEIKLLYVSPERVLTPGGITLCRRSGLTAIVVDECHCVAQWGHDFRPDYLRLVELRRVFPDVPIHAYTATAAKRTRDEIVAALELKNPVVTLGPFDRPNLLYRFADRSNGDRQLLDFVSARPTREQGIVYVMTRTDAVQFAEFLTLSGCGLAAAYHAGMDDDQRVRVEDGFASGAVRIIVATSAFGMGVDKPDVRFVVHMALPPSVESYHQETGRAGRDGQPAECLCLNDEEDAFRWLAIMGLVPKEGPIPVDALDDPRWQRISDMDQFADNPNSECRHELLRKYFGIGPDLQVDESSEIAGHVRCTACDHCTEAAA